MSKNHALSSKNKTPSLLEGTMIIGGTIVGAGLFSLPVIMSGAWFGWSMVALLLTWFCMYSSGLMILEANLNYRIGASFDMITKDLLGNGWSLFNGFSVVFVLYILTYAYISASGSVIQHTLQQMSIHFPARLGGIVFALVIAFTVWLSTKAVARMVIIVFGAKILTLIMIFSGLLWQVKPYLLFNLAELNTHYFPYVFMTLPFCLASFGYHGNVPSLMKYYGKDPTSIRRCLFMGTILALVLYVVWLVGTMGNIPRQSFIDISAQGGNIDVLVKTLSGLLQSDALSLSLTIFSNFAVASSFLGVTLGLFDYLSDLFKFDDTKFGRFKASIVTFLPAIIAASIYPDGFLYAIGFAGLAAVVWTAIVPALLAQASRKRFGSPLYRVGGGKAMIILILVFGLSNAIIFILSMFHLLPVYY